MKKFIIGLVITLTGCTSNHYTPADAGMNDALSSCRSTVTHEAASQHDHLGALVGGGLGGVGGGLLGGAIEGSQNQYPEKDWNVEIENCMAKKGYSGVSAGYN